MDEHNEPPPTMKNKAAGFYADSLEMLLDTMCNMLGGIVFIALMVALCAGDTTAPDPAAYAAQTAQLSNDLAAVTVSNTMIASEIQSIRLHLQDSRPPPPTNAMHLPNLAANTTRQPWTVIARYGKLYPLDLLSSDGRGQPVWNSQAVLVQSGFIEPRPGQGEDPASGVTRMAQAFKTSSKTNFYFAFLVYEDSFDAFARARETAVNLGFQYGWNPLPRNQILKIGRGTNAPILPQH
jgi:hypothetical protein